VSPCSSLFIFPFSLGDGRSRLSLDSGGDGDLDTSRPSVFYLARLSYRSALSILCLSALLTSLLGFTPCCIRLMCLRLASASLLDGGEQLRSLVSSSSSYINTT
jgi:hypothetical protein